MSDKTNRVRNSKARFARYLQFKRHIAAEWARAIKTQEPISVVHERLFNEIQKADLTITQRVDLGSANWASRDLTEMACGEWALYLDGKRCNGDSEAYRSDQLRGRWEYRGTGKPLYEALEPALLRRA